MLNRWINHWGIFHFYPFNIVIGGKYSIYKGDMTGKFPFITNVGQMQ
jgi:hypothetical protein